MAGVNVKWDFIKKAEDTRSVAYVPNVKSRSGEIESGATIGTGFDLGQKTRSYINSLNVSQVIKDKLYPYIGTTGPIAVVAPEVKDLIRGLDQLNRSIGAAGGSLPRPVDATRLQITEVHGRKDKLLRWEAQADGVRIAA